MYARKGRFGIYLYGGRMDSDGLDDGHEFTHDNFFGKVNLDAGRKTRIDLSFFYHNSDSVNADLSLLGPDVYNGFAMETLYGKADLRTSFADGVDLHLSAWRLRSNDNFWMKQLSTDATMRDAPIRFDRYGFSGNLAWRTGSHALVAGADSLNGTYEEEFEPHSSIDQREYALFVNDTVTAGNLSVTPGLRYDHSSLAGGLACPSLGATYLASRDLLFRALVSRGFHDPAIVKYSDAPAFGYHGTRGTQAREDLVVPGRRRGEHRRSAAGEAHPLLSRHRRHPDREIHSARRQSPRRTGGARGRRGASSRSPRTRSRASSSRAASATSRRKGSTSANRCTPTSGTSTGSTPPSTTTGKRASGGRCRPTISGGT